jgi:Natural resistance-associated macrophage protein
MWASARFSPILSCSLSSLTTAITLNRHGITHIETTRQAAEALRPLAGKFAATVFTVGIVGVGFLAIPTLAGSTAYAFAETLGWRQGLNKKPKQARWFYAYSVLNRSGSRTGLCGHKPREGALLVSCHQRTIGPLSSRRDTGRCFGQETDAGPTQFTFGMDGRGDHHSGNVHRRRGHVCCVDCQLVCSQPEWESDGTLRA